MGRTTSRGYGRSHRTLRASYQFKMDKGETFTCWRCGGYINPEHWHLGHDDHDRSKYRGPECVPCNTATFRRNQAPPYLIL